MYQRSALRVGLAAGGLLYSLAAAVLPDSARADCFLTGSTVTCSPPGTNGYSDPAGDDLTVTVQSGATVIDNGFAAIQVRDRNTVTNNGTIAAGDNAAGIVIEDDNTVRNNGTITAGAGGAGISGNDRNAVTNAGRITVGDGFGAYGIAVGFDSTVVNSGTIGVGIGGTGIAADANTALPATNSVTNSGSIAVGMFGTGIVVTDNHRILNSGAISGGDGALGIDVFGTNNVVTNTGAVAVGATGVAVQFSGDGNTLYNYGTIRATGSGYTVEGCFCTTNNAFYNQAGGTLDGRLVVDGAGNTLTNSGLLTVTDPSTPIGYPTFLVANQFLAGAGNSFVQTATGTLALRMDNAGAIDNLSADALTARGTLKVVIQPQLYQNTTFSGTAVGLTVYGAGTLGNTITSGFDRYIASSPFFAVTPIYDTGSASGYQSLSLQLDRIPFGAVPGMTDNQRAVGNAFEQGYSPSLDPNSTLGQLYITLLSGGSVGLFDQLSGEGTSAAQDASFAAADQFGNTMMQQVLAWLTGAPGGNSVTFGAPLGYAAAAKPAARPGSEAFAAIGPRPAAPGRWRAWGSAFGGTRNVSGDPGTGSADRATQTAGGAFGVDRQFGGDLLLGVAAGGSGSSFSVSSLSTSGRVDGGHVGVYGVKTFGPAYLAGMLTYAHFSNSTERTIAGLGATETARGSFDSDLFGGRLEVGWRYAVDGYVVTPFAAVEPTTLWQQAYTESTTTATGAPGVLGLSYTGRTIQSLPTFLGAQVDARYDLGGGAILTPLARLSWVHEFEPDREVEASLAGLGLGNFTVAGPRAARDALRTDLAATLSLGKGVALFASFNGEFADTSTTYAGTAGARVVW